MLETINMQETINEFLKFGDTDMKKWTFICLKK